MGGRKKDGREARKGSRRPTAFEIELLGRGNDLINGHPHHPQTNGKLERLFETLEAEIARHESLSKLVAFYNKRRLHCSLDIYNLETSPKAFSTRKAMRVIKKNSPRWMEENMNERVT